MRSWRCRAAFLLNPMNLAPQLVEIPLERPPTAHRGGLVHARRGPADATGEYVQSCGDGFDAAGGAGETALGVGVHRVAALARKLAATGCHFPCATRLSTLSL